MKCEFDTSTSQGRTHLKAISEQTRRICKLDNRLGHPHLLSYSLNGKGEPVATCVVRGTFRIERGACVKASIQEPVRQIDVYFGDPERSSLRLASDLAPWKPRGEVVFRDPLARSEGLRPRLEWQIGVRVGALVSTMWVHAPKRQVGGYPWRGRVLRPLRRIPVSYHLAEFAGGENPVGVGARPDQLREPLVLTNAAHAGRQEAGFAGLGPVPGSWPCRRRFAGTYDEDWRRDTWPLIPCDFDYEFYQVAHPSLRHAGFFLGNETVCVVGMSGPGAVEFRLPGLAAPVLILQSVQPGRDRAFAVLALDTVEIDMNRSQVGLVWRCAFEPPPYRSNATLLSGDAKEMSNAT